MLKVEDILFSNTHSESFNQRNVLFNTDINWDTDVVPVDTSYYYLKANKKFEDFTISTTQLLVGVEICNETEMINVCYCDGNNYVYFWVNLEDVKSINSIKENWIVNDVKRHIKAIKEQWTTDKKSTIRESKKKKNKVSLIAPRGILKKKMKF